MAFHAPGVTVPCASLGCGRNPLGIKQEGPRIKDTPRPHIELKML
jgi:hypothetical protein